MHPALSLILFSTASGAGYGLLAWLGLFTALGLVPPGRGFGIAAVLLALALITGGLLASVSHLGRPERSWRAVTQWRTSWLSREGIAALLTYPAALAFLGLWAAAGAPGAAVRSLGVLAGVLAVATVCCTAMIYRSLRPVRQWHNRYVLPNYLLLGLFSGAAWLSALTCAWAPRLALLPAAVALGCGLAGAAGKLLYWRFIDADRPAATPGTATGLGTLGKVRQLDPPHVEENYLQREMGFRIARKHAARLRRLAVLIAFAAPLLLEALALATAAAGLLPPAPAAAATAAALSALTGLLLERWLFFAEATHTAMAFYGRSI